ncbi:hypothetical protein [Paraburkholderia bannensis]|uniref:hypothetical protein n=1 Tax=Paraburkholderia bannensis TaxID=765414 RepID=UPI002AB64ED9|nr:hypothetical protein [Paraburkholderia bannensis]
MSPNKNKKNKKPEKITNNQKIYDPLITRERLPTSCMLCPSPELDEKGHIIPKLVARWIKHYSKKNSLYFNNNEHSKVQDTMSLRILCPNCEDKFSTQEKYFTDHFFVKYYRLQSEMKVGDELYYFALSVAWRILATTPLMKSEATASKHYGELQGNIAQFLNFSSESVPVDVYVFHGKEIQDNISCDLVDLSQLRYSIAQGIFLQNLNRMIGEREYRASFSHIPLVKFKLGIYYFFVSPSGYLQWLKCITHLETCPGGRVHSLRFSSELMGFLNHISDGDFGEVKSGAIPDSGRYDLIKPRYS